MYVPDWRVSAGIRDPSDCIFPGEREAGSNLRGEELWFSGSENSHPSYLHSLFLTMPQSPSFSVLITETKHIKSQYQANTNYIFCNAKVCLHRVKQPPWPEWLDLICKNCYFAIKTRGSMSGWRWNNNRANWISWLQYKPINLTLRQLSVNGVVQYHKSEAPRSYLQNSLSRLNRVVPFS